MTSEEIQTAIHQIDNHILPDLDAAPTRATIHEILTDQPGPMRRDGKALLEAFKTLQAQEYAIDHVKAVRTMLAAKLA